MRIDLHEPAFGQSDVVKITAADNKTLDNYVQHGHAKPHVMDGRRLYSALQIIEIEVTARLAGQFKIPPSVGTKLASKLVSDAAPVIEADAELVGAWPVGASLRLFATIRREADGTVELLTSDSDDPNGIMIVVPVQLFAREVLKKAAAMVEARSH